MVGFKRIFMNERKISISHRVVYSGWDFQQALSALTFLLEECEYGDKYHKVELRRFRCFETSLVVAFARPFKTGRGREQFDLSVIGLDLDEKELALKEKLIRLRDKVVSHSDEEEMEYRTHTFKPLEGHDLRMPVEHFRETLYLKEKEVHQIEKLLHRILFPFFEHFLILSQ